LACAIPTDSPNITFVLGYTPQDKRFFEVGGDMEGIDLGKPYADHQAAAVNPAAPPLCKASHIKTKLTEMAMIAETIYALSLASGLECFQHPSGFWIPNPLLSHYARDSIAGFRETAPSELDMRSADVGQASFAPGLPT